MPPLSAGNISTGETAWTTPCGPSPWRPVVKILCPACSHVGGPRLVYFAWANLMRPAPT